MKRNINLIDITAVKNVVELSRRASAAEKELLSKVADGRTAFSISEVDNYSKDSNNPCVRIHHEAQTELIKYLSTLHYKVLCDVRSLMYLGRNGIFDGIETVPVNQRFSFYRNNGFGYKKREMIRHIASKSPMLHEYLLTGLQLIGWEEIGDE